MMTIPLEMTDDADDNKNDDDDNDDDDVDDNDEWTKEGVVVFQDDGVVADCGVLIQPQTTHLLAKHVQSGTPAPQVCNQETT